MLRTTTFFRVALGAGLVLGALAAGSIAKASGSSCGGTGAVTTVTGTLGDGAKYEVQCPAGTWNGTLFLYSHGYVVPGSPNPPADAGDPLTAGWLLGHGFALAGSSYAATGWAVKSALVDQIGTLDAFDTSYGTPSATIAWGHSLGGLITAGLIQDYPGRFKAALPMCGVVAGGVAAWNTGLDAGFAFQQLIDPSVRLVRITNPLGNLQNAEAALARAQQSAQGRARLALVAALGDTPGWFTPLSPEPAMTDYVSQERNQYQWDLQVTFPFAFALRANLEQVSGGNASWNTGVNYFVQLAKSANLREVLALYHTAGISVISDLLKLTHAPRISADHNAVRYLANNISFNGRISFPVLTMHTTGDGLVQPENEQAYRQTVDEGENGDLLRQVFVHRAGHCTFTPAETITAVRVLLDRLGTGVWHVPAPAALNAAATALGPQYNVFTGGVPVKPAFIEYQPPLYPRPFDLVDP